MAPARVARFPARPPPSIRQESKCLVLVPLVLSLFTIPVVPALNRGWPLQGNGAFARSLVLAASQKAGSGGVVPLLRDKRSDPRLWCRAEFAVA